MIIYGRRGGEHEASLRRSTTGIVGRAIVFMTLLPKNKKTRRYPQLINRDMQEVHRI